MDKSQSEVTDKIRSAIEEKLIEINVFVDNELPDYIMILIANKRSKHHMEKDLSLFLGSQTKEFTNWLWNLVNSFKTGAKSRIVKENTNFELSGNAESKENRADEDDVLNYDPAEEGETLCFEELNEPPSNQQRETTVNPNASNTNQFFSDNSKVLHAAIKTESPITTTKVPVEVVSAKLPQVQLPIKQEIKDLVQEGSAVPGKVSQKSAKVYPIQRPMQVSSNSKERQNITTSSKPELAGGISSVVCVSQRKYGGPAALQANKLLLRAVNDATKSVLKGKDINEFYKPTSIKELEPDEVIEREIKFENYADAEVNTMTQITSENVKATANYFMNYPDAEVNTITPIARENVQSTANNFINNPDAEVSTITHIASENVKSAANNIIGSNINVDIINKERHKSLKRTINLPQISTNVEMLEDLNDSLPAFTRSLLHEEEISVTPHFIVTLDGVKFSSLKRKHSVDEAMEIDDEELEEFSDIASGKKTKLVERCKYWPACKNSDNCDYHHPTKSCKNFPDCKYGDKCFFIHPNCKFDSLCSRKDCPYTHCSKRQFKSIPTSVVRPRPIKVHNTKIVCKYYPKCTVKSCKFIHPKLCRYGTQCRAPKCAYGHFQIPRRNLLKWKAGSA